MIHLLTPRLFFELSDLHPKLLLVLRDLLPLWPSPFTITSIYRTPAEDAALSGSGIHSTTPHRALDFRIRNLSPSTPVMWRRARSLAHPINSRWQYDPSRPHLKVLLIRPHGTGPHAHLQVHPRTRRLS